MITFIVKMQVFNKNSHIIFFRGQKCSKSFCSALFVSPSRVAIIQNLSISKLPNSILMLVSSWVNQSKAFTLSDFKFFAYSNFHKNISKDFLNKIKICVYFYR